MTHYITVIVTLVLVLLVGGCAIEEDVNDASNENTHRAQLSSLRVKGNEIGDEVYRFDIDGIPSTQEPYVLCVLVRGTPAARETMAVRGAIYIHDVGAIYVRRMYRKQDEQTGAWEEEWEITWTPTADRRSVRLRVSIHTALHSIAFARTRVQIVGDPWIYLFGAREIGVDEHTEGFEVRLIQEHRFTNSNSIRAW